MQRTIILTIRTHPGIHKLCSIVRIRRSRSLHIGFLPGFNACHPFFQGGLIVVADFLCCTSSFIYIFLGLIHPLMDFLGLLIHLRADRPCRIIQVVFRPGDLFVVLGIQHPVVFLIDFCSNRDGTLGNKAVAGRLIEDNGQLLIALSLIPYPAMGRHNSAADIF